jgi:hypothetical protein
LLRRSTKAGCRKEILTLEIKKSKIQTILAKSGRVAHACNPSTQELKQEDLEFQMGLGYIVRPYLKTHIHTHTHTHTHTHVHHYFNEDTVFSKTPLWGWGMTQVIKHLPSKCKTLSSNPSTTKKKEGRKEEKKRKREKGLQ